MPKNIKKQKWVSYVYNKLSTRLMQGLPYSLTKKTHTIKTTEVAKSEVAKSEERDAFFKVKWKIFFWKKIKKKKEKKKGKRKEKRKEKETVSSRS